MSMAKILMLIGLGLFVLGVILNFSPHLFSWFGKLPGDIRIEEENRYVFFLPLTSMIIVSVVLTLLFNLFFRK